MAKVGNLLEGLAQTFGRKMETQAAATAAADAAQRAAPPKWLNSDRGLATIEALREVTAQEFPKVMDVPVEQRVRKSLGEPEAKPQASNVVNEDDMVELTDEFVTLKDAGYEVDPLAGLTSKAELGLEETPKSIRMFEEDGSVAGQGNSPVSLQHRMIDHTQTTLWDSRAYERAEDPVAGFFFDELELTRPGNEIGVGWYEDEALEELMNVYDVADASRFVGHMQLSDIPQIFGAVKKGEPDGFLARQQFLGTKPVTLRVKPMEDGFVKVVDVDGPAHLGTTNAPVDIEFQRVPVVVETVDGKPLKEMPVGYVVDSKLERGKTHWYGVVPGYNVRGKLRVTANYEKINSPRFWGRQPRTATELTTALKTMFSPEGQTFGANLSQKFWNPGDKISSAEELMEARNEYLMDMGRVRSFGAETVTGNKAARSSIYMAYQKAADAMKRDLKQAREFYLKQIGDDPIRAERIRNFGRDTVFTMELLGETHPVLKDMPIPMYHTDQNFFDPVFAGANTEFAQFSKIPAEGGMHISFVKRQADFFLPLDTADADVLAEFYRQSGAEVKKAIDEGFKKLSAVVPSMSRDRLYSYLEDIFHAPVRMNPAPTLSTPVTPQVMEDAIEEVVDKIVGHYNIPWDNTQAYVDINQALTEVAKVYSDRFRSTSQTAMFMRVKKPLIMMDIGGFDPARIAGQMLMMPEFEDATLKLQQIASNPMASKEYWNASVAGIEADVTLEKEAWAATHKYLIDLMESRGYDSIVYNNGLEAPGMPSLIVWDQKFAKLSWATLFDRRSNSTLRGIGAAMPAAGLAATADKENNNGN